MGPIKFFTVLLVSFFLSFLLTKNVKAESLNFVPNFSFEDGTTSPVPWNLSSSKYCRQQTNTTQLTTEWNHNIAKSGSKSVGFKDVSLPSGFNGTINWIESDYISIPYHNETLKVSGSVTGAQGNKNLSPTIAVCFFDDSDTVVLSEGRSTNYPPDNQFWYGLPLFGIKANSSIATKVKIGLAVYCYKSWLTGGDKGCSGTLWFDDIKLEMIRNITAHNYEDLNKNHTKDIEEATLPGWEYEFYTEPNCEGLNTQTGRTDLNGNITFREIPLGSYSIKQTFWKLNQINPPPFSIDARTEGWTNTTPLCQNVILNPGETPIVYFGNIRGPTVPYFSQKDPQWTSKEYDHGNSIGPFFCGTTIGGCGCAITSAAMLLKYHGATKSPDGAETNPDTLNTWLRNNHGYTFGALKWNSIAAYSVKANQNYQTQKIRFVGVGSGNNYSLLDNELSGNKPTILEQPGHFVLATSKQSATYNINDPAYQNRKTLESYSNSFDSMRRFEKTNTDLSAIYLSTPAPNDLFIKDALGRRAGKDPSTGEIFTEIPGSFYFLEPSLIDQSSNDPVSSSSSPGVNMLVVINPEQGLFSFSTGQGNIDVSFYDQNGEISQKEFKTDSPKNLNINYSPIPGETSSFSQEIQIDVIPTSTQNRIYPKSGNLEVLVKKSAAFDPSLFDIPSALLGNTKLQPYKSKLGKNGLSLYFKVRDLNLVESDRLLCLTAMDKNGVPLKGCDYIRVHR